MTIVVYWVENEYIKYQPKYRKTGSMILLSEGITILLLLEE